MRLLIECTYVYEHPKDNSGIQRVVRNVIKQLEHLEPGVECIPVMMSGGQLYRVVRLAPLKADRAMSLLQKAIVKLDEARNRYWLVHSHLARLWPLRASRQLRRAFWLGCKVASLGITLPLRVALFLNRKSMPVPARAVPLEAHSGDQLILLDSSWHADFFPLAEKLKSEGVGIVSVIYDLIPLTHPQFCDEGLVRVFDHWFDWIARTADGFMAISRTISSQVQSEVLYRLGYEEAQKRWHGHFHLGSELDLAHPSAQLLPSLVEAFRTPSPVYLMVSTIEPRKNHVYLLDAFELLWQQGSEARLCIIGKIGWKCEDLVRRIKQHPEWNKRLFMFNKVDDSSLEYAYAHARALVFPSYVEGFGLPLVEAMQRGLPTFASDIPVFREIGGEFSAYFRLEQPTSLAVLINRFDQTGIFPARCQVKDWRWINWQQASQQLIERILKGLQERRGRAAGDARSA